MITRDIQTELLRVATAFPVVTLTGPRQSGKSTLCRATFPDKPHANLEAPDIRSFASEDPRGFLGQFPQGAILDEVQRVPELASYLQGLVDADPEPGRWILTGSQNFQLMTSVSQSLAGRSALLQLMPLTWGEITRFGVTPTSVDAALLAGGYPRIHDKGIEPADWLQSYVGTYVERDVRTLANIGDLIVFQRFVELCAGRTGRLLNYSSLASDAGVTQPTAKAWLAVLEASFIVFRLPAFFGNQRKRLVKMPKLHFVDSGLACWLLGIRSSDQLRAHPLRGAIFESWVVAEVMKARANRGQVGSMSFYRDKDGVEADLVVDLGDRLVVVEAKSTATASPAIVAGAERLAGLVGADGRAVESRVVYGGDELQRRTSATIVPWRNVGELPWHGLTR